MEELVQHVIDTMNEIKTTLISAWHTAMKTNQNDFIAFIEMDKGSKSILILPRKTGLIYLEEKGTNMNMLSLEKLTEAATGLTPDSKAIWVVILDNDGVYRTGGIVKFVDQPLAPEINA